MSILTLIKKDFKIVLSDKKAMVILVAMPIILFSILSIALRGAFDTEDNEIWAINIGIVKLYDIDEEQQIMNKYKGGSDVKVTDLEHMMFDALDSEDLSFITYEVMTLEQAKSEIAANKLTSAVVLPQHYLSDLFINMSAMFRKPIEIRIIKNLDRQYGAEVSANVIKGISDQISNVMITRKIIAEVINTYNFKGDNFNYQAKDLEVNIQNYKLEKLVTINSGQYYSVAMMTMFLLFGASYGAKFMLVEKQDFTLQRQQMGGINTRHIILGKMVIIFLIALSQMFLMIGTSYFVFKVHWGKPFNVLLLTVLVAFSIMGMGSIIAGISLKLNSLKAINILESGIFQFLALFGGSYFPIFLMPTWFQSMSKMVLNGAALDAYLKIMTNVAWGEMIPSLMSIFLNGVIFLIIGALLVLRETPAIGEEVTT